MTQAEYDAWYQETDANLERFKFASSIKTQLPQVEDGPTPDDPTITKHDNLEDSLNKTDAQITKQYRQTPESHGLR